jgi:hypothetical protein
LAGKLVREPLHIVFSHCQRNSRESVVAYLQSQGLSADAPNFTVTSFGRHPKVKGNGYVPYYMVFNHHGDLVRHHMCGGYHGGDGLKCIALVEELLLHTPAIYLGREPFETIPKLAAKVKSGKGYAPAVKTSEERLASGKEDEGTAAELKRLLQGVERYRDRHLRRAEKQMANRPSLVIPHLLRLEKELKGTAMGEPVTRRIADLKSSNAIKTAEGMEKKFAKIRMSLERPGPCKDCKRRRRKRMNLGCTVCRQLHGPVIAKVRKQLEELAATNPELPIAETIRAFAKRLE